MLKRRGRFKLEEGILILCLEECVNFMDICLVFFDKFWGYCYFFYDMYFVFIVKNKI